MSRPCLCPLQPLLKNIFCVTVHFQPSGSMCYSLQQLQLSRRTDCQQLQLDLAERVLAVH